MPGSSPDASTPPPSQEDPVLCPSCGEVLSAHYCPACGERRPSEHRDALWPFLRDAFSHLWNVEGATWATLRLLLTRPGQLTLDYFAGRRVGRLGPLRLFILINIVFFLVGARVGVFNFTYGLYMDSALTAPYPQQLGEAAQSRVRLSGTLEKLDAIPISAVDQATQDSAGNAEASAGDLVKEAVYVLLFNAQLEQSKKTALLFMVPMFALFLWGAYARRAPQYLRHLVFSIHLYSAFLIYLLGLGALLFVLVRLFGLEHLHAAGITEGVFLVLLLAGLGTYFGLALRRVYRQPWPVTLVKLGGLVALMAMLMTAYRELLFYLAYAVLRWG